MYITVFATDGIRWVKPPGNKNSLNADRLGSTANCGAAFLFFGNTEQYNYNIEKELAK